MIEFIDFTNVYNAVSLHLNSDELTPYYPVTSYDTEITTRHESRDKSAEDGQWPTYSYLSGMDITVEGAILADDSGDYNSKRNIMMNILRYKSLPRERYDGTFYIQLDDVTNLLYAYVSVESIDCPRNGASPSYSTYRIVFHSYVPYLTDYVTSDPYYDE